MNNLVFKYLVLPLALILASGFIFWYFDLDVWNNILAARDTIVKNEEVLAQRQKLAENLKKLIAQYQERIKDVSKINQIVPAGPEIPNLLVMLEALAGENSLNFGGVDFNLVRPISGPAAGQLAGAIPAGLQIVQISVRLKGGYPNFLNYLKAVENNVRLLDTNSVTFNVPSGGASDGASNIGFTAVINAYYQ